MDPLLQVAEDLERRDAHAAAALLEVEQLEVEVDELRAHAAEVAAFLRALSATKAALDDEDRDAGEALARAAESSRTAEDQLARAQERGSESARLEAARAAQHARDALEDAELRVARAQHERQLVERTAGERGAEAERLERRGVELSQHAQLEHGVPPPETGLHGLLDWAARAHGELLVSHASLATEREKVVREATELVAGVLGEPFPGTGVAGVRERLARALRID